MALDGLGQVFEQQGNTGAAAYNNPSFRIGGNPLDYLAAQIAQQGNLALRQQQRQQQQQRAAQQKALDIDLSGWDYDNKAYFTQAAQALKSEGAKLQALGKDITNYADPDVRKWREALDKNMAAAKASANQGKTVDEILKYASAHPDEVDYNATAQKLQEGYINKTPLERVELDPRSFIAQKEKPYDALAPLADFKIADYVGSYENETPTSGYKSSTLNKSGLKKDIQAMVDNPLNQEHFEKGKAQGLWNTKGEYADFLYENAKNKYTPEVKNEVKAPKGSTLFDISNGNSGDLIGKLGAGEQTLTVPNYTVGGGESGKTVTTKLNHVVQLDNIDAVVGKSTAIDATTGKAIEGTGTIALKSAAMALPVVQKGTNRILPITAGTYKYKDASGKTHEITGSKDEIEKELVKRGIAEYKPMLYGKANDKDAAGNDKAVDVWLPADAAIHGTNDKNKALTSAEYAYEVYKKRANDLNKVDQAKRKTYSLNGKTFTQAQIEEAAKQSGVTVDEYIQQVGLK